MTLLPIVAIGLLWWLLSRSPFLPKLDLARVPYLTDKAWASIAVVLALLVSVRGNIYLALLLFGVGLWLLGRSTSTAAHPPHGMARITSKRIEMDFDKATGAMTGRILEGPEAGVALDSLDRTRCGAIYDLCRRDDAEGARLLEAYIDRRFPGWRATRHADGDARRQKARSTGGMTEKEAYQILGLGHGATREDIVRTHRALMKKWHPDQGGTVDLAARANEAKEVLLRRWT